MKKIIFIIIILLGSIGGYYYYQNIYLPSQKPTLEVETNKVDISEYYIYGNHLNIKGTIKKLNAKYKKYSQKNNDIYIDTTFISKNNIYFDNPNSYYPNNLAYKEISKKIIRLYQKN